LLWLTMPGVPALSLIAQQHAVSITPADGASDSIVTYVLGYGPLGIVFLGAVWLLYKGWRLVSPDSATAMRAEGRTDLIAERDRILSAASAEQDRVLAAAAAERDRLIGEKREAERQRDDALDVARAQLIPLLVNFTSATQSLLPILQALAVTGARHPHEGAGD
jgi:hypothetical protein